MSDNTPDTAPAWKWYASTDGEHYHVGPCPTREEAIQAAREDFDGEPFHVLEAVMGDAVCVIPSAFRLIERALEDAADNGMYGENGDYTLSGTPEVLRAAHAELDAALKTWGDKWRHLFPPTWKFLAYRNGEWVPENTRGES